jgi:2'-hydroxyisoflavone reductase
VLAMAAAHKAGIYNVTGPDYTLTMGKLLDTCKNVTRSDATFTWVNDEFLMEHEVGPFSELPLWIPETYNGLQSLNINKALAAGLSFRPLEDTIRDTLKWNSLRTGADGGIKARAGMMQDREQTLLHAWKERV